LSPEEELRLARAWRDHKDEAARNRLVEAYAPFATAVAKKYIRVHARNDKGKAEDLKGEAYIGLLKATEKFDPDKVDGAIIRFSTYAHWWIKARVQDYIMRNVCMTGMQRTSIARSLFLRLSVTQKDIERENPDYNADEVDEALAEHFSTSPEVIRLARASLKGDYSLNAQISNGDGEGMEWIETLPADDQSSNAEEIVSAMDEFSHRSKLLSEAMNVLSDREKDILTRRRLTDTPETLEKIGQDYGLSKERIRQLDDAAFKKLQRRMRNLP
jgi:RNA polymerase sigma-32 factor